MSRCSECNSVIAKRDIECYVCGEPVPGAKKRFTRAKKAAKPTAAATPFSNVLFVVSIGLTIVSFFSHKLPFAFSLAASGILFLARLCADRMAAKRQLPLSPVTVARVDR